MALIRRADALTATRDALVLDLGDLARQGEAIMQNARQRASGVIEDALRERDKLLGGAREAGRTEGISIGHAEGFAKGREEGKTSAIAESKQKIAAIIAAWTAALERFAAERDMLLAEARQDVLQLALEIAARITRRTIAADPTIVAEQMEAVLSLVAKPTRARILVHPEDEALAKDLLPGMLPRLVNIRHVDITADPAVERGSCRMHSDGGATIDADIAMQLDRIAQALVPERKPPEGRSE
ncbi:MAG: hypothetical protein IT435_00920 [Phycisphaerales bacterium]|nr:hypothetical protein [Phycisphaerales bacterium]